MSTPASTPVYVPFPAAGELSDADRSRYNDSATRELTGA